MAANNWDIEIIKDEAQTASHMRRPDQTPQASLFSSPGTCIRLYNTLLSNTPVRNYQNKLMLLSIQMVTCPTKGERTRQSTQQIPSKGNVVLTRLFSRILLLHMNDL